MAALFTLCFISVHAFISARYLPFEAALFPLRNVHSDTDGGFRYYKLFPEVDYLGKHGQNGGDAVKICVFNNTGGVHTMNCTLYKHGTDVNDEQSTTNEHSKKPVSHNTIVRTVYTTNIFNLGDLKRDQLKEYEKNLNTGLNLIVKQKNSDEQDDTEVKIFGDSEDDNTYDLNYNDLEYTTKPDDLHEESESNGDHLKIYYEQDNQVVPMLTDLILNVDDINEEKDGNLDMNVNNGSKNNESGKNIEVDFKDESLNEEEIIKNELDMKKPRLNEDKKDNEQPLQNELIVDKELENSKANDVIGKVKEEMKKGNLEEDKEKIDVFKIFNDQVLSEEKSKNVKLDIANDSNNKKEVANTGTIYYTKELNEKETEPKVNTKSTDKDSVDTMEDLNTNSTNKKIFDTLELEKKDRAVNENLVDEKKHNSNNKGENEKLVDNFETDVKANTTLDDLVDLKNTTNEKVSVENKPNFNEITNTETNLINKDLNDKVIDAFKLELKDAIKNRKVMDNNELDLNVKTMDNEIDSNKLGLQSTGLKGNMTHKNEIDKKSEVTIEESNYNNEHNKEDKRRDGDIADNKLRDTKELTNAVLNDDFQLVNKRPINEDSTNENKSILNNDIPKNKVNANNEFDSNLEVTNETITNKKDIGIIDTTKHEIGDKEASNVDVKYKGKHGLNNEEKNKEFLSKSKVNSKNLGKNEQLQDKTDSSGDATKHEVTFKNEQGIHSNTINYTVNNQISKNNEKQNIKEVLDNKLQKVGNNDAAVLKSEFENNLNKTKPIFNDILTSFMNKVSLNFPLPNPSINATERAN